MPYSSDKQRRWAHTDSAKKAGFPTEEFDKASKGMADGGVVAPDDQDELYALTGKEDTNKPNELYALTGQKYDEGGIVSYTPPPPNGSLDEVQGSTPTAPSGDDDFQGKPKWDLGAVNADIIAKHGPKPKSDMGNLGTEKTGLQGIMNNLGSGGNGNLNDPGFAGGGITFPHRERSGPAINEVPHPDYANGGLPGYDEGLNPFDSSDQAADLLSGGGSAIPYLKGQAGKAAAPADMSDPASAGLTPPQPAVDQNFMNQLQQGTTGITAPPKFNPMASHPASYPATPATPVQPETVVPTNTQGTSDYVNQQQAAIGKYGPEQQLAVEQAIRKGQNSPGSLVGQGLAGLGDAIMQGVGRTGNPGFLKGVQERQQAQGAQQLGAYQRAGTQNMQQVEAKQKLDAIDPKSGLSQSKQNDYAPLLSKLGYSKSAISNLSANGIDSAVSLMTQFGGKQIEMMIKQFELGLEAQKVKETGRHNVAEEGAKAEETAGKAAETIVKPPTFLDRILGNPTTQAQRGGAGNVLAKQAGVEQAPGAVGPLGATTVKDGKSYTWSPVSGKYHPTEQ